MCWYIRIYRKHVLNQLQTYCDGRFNMVVHFYTPYDQTVDRWQTSPTNCNLPASGRQPQGSPAHIYRKDVVTKKIMRKCHFFTKSLRNQFWWLDNKQIDYQDNKTWKFLENENLEVDRWALSLSLNISWTFVRSDNATSRKMYISLVSYS